MIILELLTVAQVVADAGPKHSFGGFFQAQACPKIERRITAIGRQ